MESRKDIGLIIRNWGHFHYGMNMPWHMEPPQQTQHGKAEALFKHFNQFTDDSADEVAKEVAEYMEAIYDFPELE